MRSSQRGHVIRGTALKLVVLLTTLAAIASTPCSGAQKAQGVRPEVWIADGQVSALAVHGNTLYAGGSFGYVGPETGAAVPVDASSGAPRASFPLVEGTVYAIAPDSYGGWFIGGLFTAVAGSPRNNLAHILPNGAVDSWNPGPVALAPATGGISAIAIGGDRLYVAGRFSTIAGQPRNGVASFDQFTGQLTGWDPQLAPLDTWVTSLGVSGTTIYIAGPFTSAGNETRNYLAALDAVTGLPTPWNPQPDDQVFSLAPCPGGVYVGGHFTVIGNQSRYAIAKLDSATGQATEWNPDPGGADPSISFVTLVGDQLFVNGNFLSIGGQARNYLAALDTLGGSATDWNPNLGGTGRPTVLSLTVLNSTAYMAGQFTTVGGAQRDGIAAVDAIYGSLLPWTPIPTGKPAGATFMTVAGNGTTVYVGGRFSSLYGKIRNGLAAFDLSTGAATPWNPGVSGSGASVNCLVATNTKLYVAGSFSGIGGMSRNGIAALSLVTGAPTIWDPNANGVVRTLVLNGARVYAGGGFTSIGGQTRVAIAALDTVLGQASPWNANAGGASPTVEALAVDGQKLYAGGTFTSIGGQPRQYAAALNFISALATPWNPGPDADVKALCLSGSTAYLGGNFDQIGGQIRRGIAALDTSLGDASGWNPQSGGLRFDVQSLARRGDVLFAGGHFDSVGTLECRRLAAIDLNSAVATTYPEVGVSAELLTSIATLAVDGSTLFAGGTFDYLGGQPRLNLTAIDFSSVGVPPIAQRPATNLALSGSPNPFVRMATLHFSLPASGPITLRVYDLAGRIVATLAENSWRNAGPQTERLDAIGLPSGVYLCRIEAGHLVDTKRMVLIR